MSCIIAEISDPIIASGAKAGQHKTPMLLFSFLSLFNTDTANSTPCPFSTSSIRYQQRSRHRLAVEGKTVCRRCQKTRHIAKNCRFTSNATNKNLQTRIV